MRQMTEHDIDQVKALLDVMIQEELNGHVCLAGIPVFPTKEEAAAWNEKGEKEQ